MVSIMPGMDWVAPERTLTSRGFGPRPNVREVWVSSQPIRSSTSSQMASIVAAGSARYRSPTAVVMQKAGGTGSWWRRIVWMPWPLLPSSSRGWFDAPSSNTTGCSARVAPLDAWRWAPLPDAVRAVVHPFVDLATDADVGTPAMFPHVPADKAP